MHTNFSERKEEITDFLMKPTQREEAEERNKEEKQHEKTNP